MCPAVVAGAAPDGVSPPRHDRGCHVCARCTILTVMDEGDLARIVRAVVWDYRYDADDVVAVLRGRRERIGHLDKPALFVRMLQTLPWQRIVAALSIGEVRRLLTPETIARLWPPSTRERYERIRLLLRGDAVPPAEWSAEHAGRLRNTVLSDRWYRTP